MDEDGQDKDIARAGACQINIGGYPAEAGGYYYTMNGVTDQTCLNDETNGWLLTYQNVGGATPGTSGAPISIVD